MNFFQKLLGMSDSGKSPSDNAQSQLPCSSSSVTGGVKNNSNPVSPSPFSNFRIPSPDKLGFGFTLNPDETNSEAVLYQIEVRNISVSSNIRGVLGNGGTTTGDVPVSTSLTWKEAFQDPRVNVKMNPKTQKLMDARTRRELDIDSQINEYSMRMDMMFMLHMRVITRPRPRKKRKRNPSGQVRTPRSPTNKSMQSAQKNNPNMAKTNCLKSIARYNKEESMDSSQECKTPATRSRRQQWERKKLNKQTLQKAMSRNTSPVCKSHRHSELGGNEVPGPSRPICLDHQNHQHKFSSSSLFRKPTAPGIKVNLSNSSVNVGLRPTTEFVCRDESTMDGDILYEDEPDLKSCVHRYISQHFSNRDMLQIREELMSLKRRESFQSLTRLIPFTSSFLNSVFVDVNQRWE